MSFAVSKKPPVLVAPAAATPSGYLPLSYFDRLPAQNFFIETIFVYRHGVEPARVVREAVARVLVPYYPLAGRLTTDTDDGKMHVACTGDGLWFVEASAGFGLEEVDFLERQPLKMPKDELLPSLPSEIVDNGVPFMIQVTEFKCGGFTIGFKSSHVMFDGIGAAQFKTAIGEMARGLAEPTTRPVWCRDAIPSPPEDLQNETQLTHSAEFTAHQFEHYTTDVPLDAVNRLQEELQRETGQRCSVFDVVTAKLWQCRTRAIGPAPGSDVTLSFPANIRGELREELPSEGGYYGNCTMPFVVKAPGAKVASAPLSEIVTLIMEAKRSLPAKVRRFLKGEKEHGSGADDLSTTTTLTYGTTNLTDMRRVGLSDADYGWGAPAHVVPLVYGPINLCLILNSPLGKKHIRLLTHCVAKEHLQAFVDELKSLQA
ncbi:putative 3'-N-debenzoyl-2'-deoxytaxol N-benzoyltransferase [Iris pallida]|uniref:3'-N-debenzoyl-2'-deoxytaxol N-benzoyltransferase n=1 Tax=Iris pallida TaxID=29817 RepID=A0AAX6EEY7_IRIPA|nr:putative 3'-N-debenzoyl-2'-deoxytaxol N-benzoyltransferase [Iris pallida]